MATPTGWLVCPGCGTRNVYRARYPIGGAVARDYVCRRCGWLAAAAGHIPDNDQEALGELAQRNPGVDVSYRPYPAEWDAPADDDDLR